MQIIFTELDNIAKAGPSEGDLNKVKEFMLKKHAEDLKENSYWLGSIDEYLFTGMNPIKDYEQIVNSITVKDIQKFTDDLFKQKNEIEVSMISPETPDKRIREPYTQKAALFDERQRSFFLYKLYIYKYYESFLRFAQARKTGRKTKSDVRKK